MARSRNIKPGFFTNDALSEVEPLGRLLFAGLWCHADRDGRLDDRPKKIKAEILPYDDCNVDKLLSDLEKAGFIIRYATEQGKFIQILTFSKHQNPHIKEAESTIPAPDLNNIKQVLDTSQSDTSPADSLNPITDSLNLIHDSPKKHMSEYSDDFVTFWTSYPKKTGKGDAWITWKKLKPDINQVLSALSWQTRSQQWQSGYIPNPKTYLNGRRWEDSPTREIQQKQTKHDVYMDTINQIFPERRNGTNRSTIDITPSVTIEGDRTGIPEAVIRLRKSDGD